MKPCFWDGCEAVGQWAMRVEISHGASLVLPVCEAHRRSIVRDAERHPHTPLSLQVNDRRIVAMALEFCRVQ